MIRVGVVAKESFNWCWCARKSVYLLLQIHVDEWTDESFKCILKYETFQDGHTFRFCHRLLFLTSHFSPIRSSTSFSTLPLSISFYLVCAFVFFFWFLFLFSLHSNNGKLRFQTRFVYCFTSILYKFIIYLYTYSFSLSKQLYTNEQIPLNNAYKQLLPTWNSRLSINVHTNYLSRCFTYCHFSTHRCK